jgi:hypothetical protein
MEISKNEFSMSLYAAKLQTSLQGLGFDNFQEILRMTPKENPDVLSYSEKFPSIIAGQGFNIEYLFFLEKGRLQYERLGVLAANLVKWEPVFQEYVHLNVEAASAVFHKRNGGFKNRQEIVSLFDSRENLIVDQLRMRKVADEIKASHHHSLLKRM